MNEPVDTDRRPLRHLATFILIGLYTVTRAGAITSTSITRGIGRSFVDVQRGIFYRLADGAAETKKRQPPVPIPLRLLAHTRRWIAKGVVRYAFIEWNGQPAQSVRSTFGHAIEPAGLDDEVTPHTLRHTLRDLADLAKPLK